MSLDDLPDEMMELIISKIFWIEDLINLLSVNRRFYHLVKERLSNIKFLMRQPLDGSRSLETHFPFVKDLLSYYPAASKYSNTFKLLRLTKHLPRLKVFDIKTYEVMNLIYASLFEHNPDICGLWCWRLDDYPGSDEAISVYKREVKDNPSVMDDKYLQFSIHGNDPSFLYPLTLTLGLKRLHIDRLIPRLWPETSLPFSSLETLEIGCYVSDKIQASLKLIDRCPSLRNLFIAFYGTLCLGEIFDINDTFKINLNLENIVLEFHCKLTRSLWKHLLPLLRSYPNLKAIAIRGNWLLEDFHVKSLLHHFKNLETIDVRGSRTSDRLVVYIDNFNQIHRNGHKSVTLIHGPESKSPVEKKLVNMPCEKANRPYQEVRIGIDFMENIFPLPFDYLPEYLAPKSDLLLE